MPLEILVLKLVVTPLLIAAATLVARRWGPGVGGWLAGFPLTSAPVSVFFALALNTPVQYLAKYLPGKSRLSATAAAFLAIVVVLGLFVFLVVPPIVQQTVRLVDTIPALIDENRGRQQ